MFKKLIYVKEFVSNDLEKETLRYFEISQFKTQEERDFKMVVYASIKNYKEWEKTSESTILGELFETIKSPEYFLQLIARCFEDKSLSLVDRSMLFASALSKYSKNVDTALLEIKKITFLKIRHKIDILDSLIKNGSRREDFIHTLKEHTNSFIDLSLSIDEIHEKILTYIPYCTFLREHYKEGEIAKTLDELEKTFIIFEEHFSRLRKTSNFVKKISEKWSGLKDAPVDEVEEFFEDSLTVLSYMRNGRP